MANGLISTFSRCVHLSNLVCHRWYPQKFYRLAIDRLKHEEIRASQYSTRRRNCHPVDSDGVKLPRKKTVRIPKITLYVDNEMLVLELEDAIKMAKRRSLCLKKVTDHNMNSEREVYRLMTEIETYEHVVETEKEDNERKTKKDFKIIMFSNKITAHDFNIKMNKIKSLLKKQHKCSIIKTCDASDVEKLTQVLSDTLKEYGVITSKTVAKGSLRITVEPLEERKKANVKSAADDVAICKETKTMS